MCLGLVRGRRRGNVGRSLHHCIRFPGSGRTSYFACIRCLETSQSRLRTSFSQHPPPPCCLLLPAHLLKGAHPCSEVGLFSRAKPPHLSCTRPMLVGRPLPSVLVVHFLPVTRVLTLHTKYNGISCRYIRQSPFNTQVSRTIPGYVTARSLCWCHCPCLWGARWFSWTSSWSAVELWDKPQYCWPQYNSPTVWGLRSSLQLPGLSLHWAAMLSSVVMPPAIQHLPWPGSKPQPTQVDDQGC